MESTGLSTLSLHDALPIYERPFGPDDQVRRLRTVRGRLGCQGRLDEQVTVGRAQPAERIEVRLDQQHGAVRLDRKSTRLNSSHVAISYAVFCLKKISDHVF